MGCVPPAPGFLEGIRQLTKELNILLIFDEVITGFRLAYGGAQERFGITPDLTCLGKIIGGGLPVGAYGGKAEIMDCVAPDGPVYQAGTLSGNPLAMAAGIAMLRELQRPGVYAELERRSARFAEMLNGIGRETGIAAKFNRVGSMLTVFFADDPVTTSTRRCDRIPGDMVNTIVRCWPRGYISRHRSSRRPSCPWPIRKKISIQRQK